MTNDERGTDGGYLEGLYRRLPSLNDLLLTARFEMLLESHSRNAVVGSARAILNKIRREISDGQHTPNSLAVRVASLADDIASELVGNARFSLQPVINATGVILHTNLGGAPLSQPALDHIVEVAKGYRNLELDLVTGERSRRDVHAESLILRLLNIKTGMIGGEISNVANFAALRSG